MTKSAFPAMSAMTAFGAGLAVGGLAGLLAPLVRDALMPRSCVVIAGVDLTGINLAQPFFVDLSVLPTAHPTVKLEALNRLNQILHGFRLQVPHWSCAVDVWAPTGRFVLVVVPTPVQPMAWQRPQYAVAAGGQQEAEERVALLHGG